MGLFDLLKKAAENRSENSDGSGNNKQIIFACDRCGKEYKPYEMGDTCRECGGTIKAVAVDREEN